VDLEKLRQIWRELDCAKKSATQAKHYQTDAAVVYGAVGFALEHIEKAIKMVEELGRDEKRNRIKRALINQIVPREIDLFVRISLNARCCFSAF
jgi:hypothetical protein